MELKVYNTEAKEVGSIELNDSVFGVEYNEALIHQVVVAQLCNRRQGTKSALTRAEVRGGGKKPWRQKGTGRARQGSIRSPQWIKGGVVFAPKPRDFGKKVNKNMRWGAMLSAISYRVNNSELTVLDKVELAEAKTKLIQKILKNFGIDKKVLLVTDKDDEAVLRASKNIQDLTVVNVDLLNTYDIVANTVILATVDALKKFEEAFA